MSNSQKSKQGRPIKNIINPIDDTPQNIAKAIMKGEPKKDWEYLKDKK